MSPAAKRITGNAFLLGVAAILLDALAFLFDLPYTGFAFAVGVLLCLGASLASIILGEKAKTEDVLTMIAGAAFFIWLIAKNL